jgi:hypothetical protein
MFARMLINRNSNERGICKRGHEPHLENFNVGNIIVLIEGAFNEVNAN